MSQTFTDWKDVPSNIEEKIYKIWSSRGTAVSKTTIIRGKEVTVYNLNNYTVLDNVDYLTDEQKIRLFELAVQHGIILSDFLSALTFEPECIMVHNEIYHIPGIIVGTWPHCNLYGGMIESGDIHT